MVDSGQDAGSLGNGAESRGEYVYTYLLDRIRNGEIKAGERLTEVDVARQLGVSRTPVREAFKHLHARRLLQIVPGRGMELVELSTKEVIDLYDMRSMMEGMAASLAAEYATRKAIDNMYALVDHYAANLDNPQILARANIDFHAEILGVCENDYLKNAISTLGDTLGLVRGRILNSLSRRQSIVDEHRAIVDAIARRDRTAAESIARHHVNEAKRYRLRVSLED